MLPALPLLEYALAVTGGYAAVMAQTGRFATPTEPGQALVAPHGRIALRVDPERLRAGVVDRGRGERMLQFVDRRDDVVHRVRALSPTDTLVFDGLARPEGKLGAEAPRDALPPVRTPWHEADQLAQLDGILADGGVMRRQRLVDLYEGEVRSVELGVLPIVLDHLCATQLPVSAAVFSGGVVQLADGVVQLVSSSDEGRLGTVLGQCTIDVDLALVHESVLVRSHGPHGQTSAIELYDAHGRTVAMFTQLGIVGAEAHAAWEDLADSLPVASW
ncbi:hypothetical protein N8K70_03225 [Microbacterium betulae]|uniref:Haemin-degrading HemS/ChuX domain-containing protein n=1 Tax=Microbacterium betulae TaxID=2981139 RepID=A0AA97FJ82_9MICO|nr:hypothetical protein [Microbacterium sp. AB]WOF23704.1 hypothetical protein N8K70_03225 [Microbacterium sp. AB]